MKQPKREVWHGASVIEERPIQTAPKCKCHHNVFQHNLEAYTSKPIDCNACDCEEFCEEKRD